MKQALFCKHCGTRLSNWVEPVVTRKGVLEHCDFGSIGGDCYGDPVAFIGQGLALMARVEDVNEYLLEQDPHWGQEPADAYINLDDLLPSAEPITGRLSGCSGSLGLWGATHACKCKAEIGIEYSDCSTWFTFAVDHKNTIWKTK